MADNIPIQLRYSTTLAQIPTTAPSGPGQLVIGEVAFNIAATGTKMWIGDNVTGNNRLLLSTDEADTPVLTSKYLKLSGGTLTGPILTTGTPTGANAGQWLVNKDFVDQAVASGAQRQGAYNATTNVPPLNPPSPTPSNGQYWDVSVGGTSPTTPVIPGIPGGTQLNPGAKLIWNSALLPTPGFELIPGGGITQQDGDARYVMLAGSTMPAGATLTLTAPYNPTGLQVATAAYVSGSYVPLAGGVTMTGNLTLGTTTTPVGGLNVYGAVVVHGSGGTFNFVSENHLTGAEALSTWELWADGDGVNSYAMLCAGNSAGPGNDQPRLLVRSNGAVEVGSPTFTDAHIECWGSIRCTGPEACFFYESENEPGLAAEWYMWARGTSAVGTETCFAPETMVAPATAGPALVIRADGRLVVQSGPRTGAAGASDAVRRQDVDTWVTKISGGTF